MTVYRQIAITPPKSLKFRDELASNLPTWLNGYWGGRYVYPMGLFLDIWADATIFAVQARFPDGAPEDAFTWLAQDRQIDRGFQEPISSYKERLKLWLDLWRRAGSAESVMVALGGYIAPSVATMRTVSNSSAWDTIEAGESPPPVHTLVSPPNWDWDSAVYNHKTADPTDPEYTAKWYRAWVVIYPPSSLWVKDLKCGTGIICGSGFACGYSGTTDEGRSIKEQVRKWKPAHATIVNIMLAFDSTVLDPASAYPNVGVLPDGRFRWYGVRDGDSYIPIRGTLGTTANRVSYLGRIKEDT